MSPDTTPAMIAPLPTAKSLQGFIAHSARRWRTLVLIEAVVGVVAMLLACFLLAVVLDSFLYLPVIGRLAVNATFIVAALWLVVRLIRRLRSLRLSDDEVALAIERQTPGGLQNRLINTIQLARQDSDEAPLTSAVVRENCERLGRASLPAVGQSRPASIRVAVAAGLLFLGGTLVLWQPARFLSAATRVLLPLAHVEPAYRTTLTVEPGDIEASGDVPLHIQIHGERPETLTVLTDCQGQRDQIVVAVPDDATEVTHTLRGISRSLAYSVRGNDFTSPTYHITVATPAALALLRVTFTYPPYCGRPPRSVEQAGGDLEALQGTTARLHFILDQPVEDAALLLDRVPAGAVPQRLALDKTGPNEFQVTLTLDKLAGYRIETRQHGRTVVAGPRYAVRLLVDQEPRLELVSLARQVELQPEGQLALTARASDDFGLREVGLFTRPTGGKEDWRPVVVWPVQGAAEFRRGYSLAVSALQASEGERVELALRAIDTDPLKQGSWCTGPVHVITVGGEGVALQVQYEQILNTEAGLKTLLADQKKAAAESAVWLRKLDGDGELRWDDPKNIATLHAALKKQAATQKEIRQSAGKLARGMVAAAGDLRLGLAMLADTEMNRAFTALEGVPGRDGPASKRAAVADARSAQNRTASSLEEMIEAYASFRATWELANMLPFVRMLADRQKQLAALSAQSSTAPGAALLARKRQQKVLDLVRLIRPAFSGLEARLETGEPILSRAFGKGAKVLGPEGVQGPLQLAYDELGASRWSSAASHQKEAARQLLALHDQLNEARAEAARQLLAALREKARTDTAAQKALEQLKLGTSEAGVKDFPNDIKIEDIVRNREVAQAPKKPASGPDGTGPAPGDNNDGIDRAKLELLKDSGVRQDPNILSLGNKPEASMKLPNAFDTERNKVKPFVQEKFEDLVGKLLEEADEIDKNYQTLTLSTNQNNSDPGDIAKQGGRINSTGAVAATGNKKPPTTNHGGVARSGRSGARAYGSVLGDQAVSRRGRDQAQEGEQRVPDQAGKIKETKGDDPYTDTSTGVGGKKVESDDTAFSVKDAGKFTPDMLDRMDKPQKKYSIVERKGPPLDPQMAALLRDTTSKQAQLIERLKTIRKELKTLYLPTDHIDRSLRELAASLERLKERPDAELFRLQLETLDRLRGAVKVFRGAGSSLQPSLPRERVIRGRVVDEPGRQTLPGYEGAVKRYYERLADQ